MMILQDVVVMRINLPSALKPVYMKILLIGGLFLMIGLVSPWYQLSENLSGEDYSLSAFGGSIVDKQGTEFFNPLTGLLSFCFALICVVLPFVCRRLSEPSKRKYATIAGVLAGVCGLTSVAYFHSWLDLAFPDGLLFYHDLNVSRGFGFGYFIAWIGLGLLFSAAYVSRGLVLESKRES